MTLQISCAFATELATPDHIAVAERLGYRTAWCYDSPAVCPDVWMILALAAERTRYIGLGPGVLIPSLRSPVVTAAAIGTLAAQAPGRVQVGVGSGFTGRVALGQRPMRWSDVHRYVEVVRALLRGEITEWDGAAVELLHPDRCAAPRPIDPAIVIGADGPRGLAVAEAIGDGVFSANPSFLQDAPARRRILLMWGSVLGPGEDIGSARVQAALRPATAVLYHATYDRGGVAVDALPAGRQWRAAVEQVPAARRHLAVHAGHQVALNAADQVLFPAADQMMTRAALVGPPSQIADQLAEWHDAGITEIAYQPGGPDIPGELERFVAAARG